MAKDSFDTMALIKITGSHELCINMEWLGGMAFNALDHEVEKSKPKEKKGGKGAKGGKGGAKTSSSL